MARLTRAGALAGAGVNGAGVIASAPRAQGGFVFPDPGIPLYTLRSARAGGLLMKSLLF